MKPETALDLITEIATEGCGCDFPEPGETGIVLCYSCRARAILRDVRAVNQPDAPTEKP